MDNPEGGNGKSLLLIGIDFYKDMIQMDGKAWKDNDNTQHPRQWVRWSADRKSAMGVSWEDDTVLGAFDDFYYYGWNSDGDALLPKPLAGLKVSKVNEAKQTSASMLSQTDWYVTRKSEANTAIPSGITETHHR